MANVVRDTGLRTPINGNSNIGALPGATTAYFSTPDSSAVSVTGNIDIQFYIAAADWTPAAYQGIVSSLSATQGYEVLLTTGSAGTITFVYGDGGAQVLKTSTAAVSFADGTSGWGRVTRNSTTGDITFYTSLDGSTWTQLGTVVTSTAGSMADSPNTLLIGTRSGAFPYTGKAYRVKIFNSIGGTTPVVDFNPNSWTSGATWTSATGETWTINGGASVVAVSLGGYLPEPAATEIMLATNVRDMTTAGWTLGATMTRARSSVGADGVANKATRLTGGAVAATNIITSTIVAAASTRTYSVLIKRVTGTGPVRITQDNFATSTDISSLINSSTFTLVQIAQSQLNAVFGIKIDTNADAIDADWNSFIAGDLTGLINSRIPDTISTRNADVLTYATTGWLNAAAGTLYAEWFNPNLSQTTFAASLNDASVNNYIGLYDSTITTGNFGVVTGGVGQATLSAVSLTGAAVAKAVGVYQANDYAGFANNTSLGTDAAGTIPTVTRLEIGALNVAQYLGHYVRKVSYYPLRMANSVAQSLTV